MGFVRNKINSFRKLIFKISSNPLLVIFLQLVIIQILMVGLKYIVPYQIPIYIILIPLYIILTPIIFIAALIIYALAFYKEK
jgi:hypothetical protein